MYKMRTCKLHRWFEIAILIVSCLVGNISAFEEEENDSEKCDCGIVTRSRESASRVIHGEEVFPQDKYPWMVHLIKKDAKIFCGGTVIAPRIVLTAAHCMQSSMPDITPKEFDKCMNNPGEKEYCWLKPSKVFVQFAMKHHHIPVLKIVPHKQYNPEVGTFDIAVMILKEALPCSDSSRPICLPHKFKYLMSGQRLIVVGWGTSDIMSEHISKTLKQGQLEVIDKSECKFLEVMLSKPDSVLCLSGGEKQSPCYGDSGGPLIKKNESTYYQFGVTSMHMSSHCNPEEPAIFTDVIYFLPWIKEQLRRYGE